MTDEATVFVPGHITGFFTISEDDDPTKAGSQGAGLALSDGVTVTVQAADERAVYLDDTSIEVESVERVLDALNANVLVDAESDLPLGAGFGVSGALALGAAIATNRVLGRALSENELITIAHGAEVQAGTGLGDVVAQAKGGIPIRLEPGGPQHNTLDAVPSRARVEYLNYDELSTESVLDERGEQLNSAGEKALSLLVQEPTLSSFIYASRGFAREAELLTPRVATVIDDVSDTGGQASMAMLGETVFALGTGLSDAGYEPESCSTYPAGVVFQ
ncbi:pantoate kinase [Natranaeroarchaeum sulfidigenes]|uniref:Pantoate kinase n=1 Tax=Natranaeroarchaeum sulfidigenes TaxID=2784880 RepID=A0A897MRQ4_9EURY|nr:pantoate kinase [Natranaeroarchaeum sulfidigenes]QSG03244.1 Pantoate kinase [Natranaeroarchaeum sulfidigenes]